MYRSLAKLMSLAFDNFNGRCVYGCQKYLDKTQWLKKTDLERLQLKRLKALLRYAYANVPYYNEAFKRANFDPVNFRSLDDLSKIPVLKRSALVEQLNQLKSPNIGKRKAEIWTTSGTTAMPVRLIRGKTDLSWGVAAELRGFGWAGYETGDRHGLLWIVHSNERQSLIFKLKNLLMRSILLDVTSISEQSMASFSRKAHFFKPQFLRGYSTATSVFAAYVLQSGSCEINPRAIFTSACNLFPHYRSTIERAFGCRVFDYYATAEMSHIAAQCGHHKGLHVSEENVLVETVKDDEPASSGEEGKIVVTNLHNYAMPFIRYEIGDTGKFYSDKCACGRELSLLSPTGRSYEYFVDGEGSFTTLHDFQTVFEGLPIQDFQVVQESFDEIVIKIVPAPGFTRKHSAFVLKNIKSHGVARVRVQLVDSIPMERTGKVRHLVSKIPSKYSSVLKSD